VPGAAGADGGGGDVVEGVVGWAVSVTGEYYAGLGLVS
jgi:hypothetical protein